MTEGNKRKAKDFRSGDFIFCHKIEKECEVLLEHYLDYKPYLPPANHSSFLGALASCYKMPEYDRKLMINKLPQANHFFRQMRGGSVLSYKNALQKIANFNRSSKPIKFLTEKETMALL